LVALRAELGERLDRGVGFEVGFVAAGDFVGGTYRPVDCVGATGFEQGGWELELVEVGRVVALGGGARK
jgi:hypothetical protein